VDAPVGILLAAGRGRRFDPLGARSKLMAALPLSETPVLAASARAFKAALARVVAVVRPGESDVAALLLGAGCEVIVCEDADTGMAASLAAGLRAASEASGWIVGLADMPWVQAGSVQALADALASGAVIAAPVHQGRRGNPVGLSKALLPELLALRGDEGARRLIDHHGFTAIEVDDAGVLRDVDTPADLAAP